LRYRLGDGIDDSYGLVVAHNRLPLGDPSGPGVFFGDKKARRKAGLWAREIDLQPWNFIISGTISSATMLMILISGLMAGPAVSL